MKFLRNFWLVNIIFFLVIMLLIDCTTSKKTVIKNNETDSLFFSIEKTPCYGKCAAYKVIIYKSGFATMNAIRFVPEKEGMYKTQFTAEEMKMISGKAEEIKYFNLENVYDSPVTDLPTVITGININGKNKTIRNRHNAPAELRQFEKFADEMIHGKTWKKSE